MNPNQISYSLSKQGYVKVLNHEKDGMCKCKMLYLDADDDDEECYEFSLPVEDLEQTIEVYVKLIEPDITAHFEVAIGDGIESSLNELMNFQLLGRKRLLSYFNGAVCLIEDTFVSKNVMPRDRLVLFSSKTIYPDKLREFRRSNGKIGKTGMSLENEEGLHFYARCDVRIHGILFHREISNKPFVLKVMHWPKDTEQPESYLTVSSADLSLTPDERYFIMWL